MWLEMWAEMMGSWAGVASLAVILLSALAIPAGVVWTLLVRYKGPMERAYGPDEPTPPRVRRGRGGHRYAH